MNVINEDTVPGVALLALAGLVAWISLDMGTGAGGATLKPNFFPLICSAGLALCGANLTVRGLLASDVVMPVLVDRRLAIVAALLIVFFWGFDHIDFRVGAWVVALVSMLVFDIRSPKLLIIYPLALSMTLYLSFTIGFSVVLPTWN